MRAQINAASILAGILCGLLGAPLVVRAQDGGSIAEGAQVYGDVCGRCHNPRSPLERSDRDWVTIVNHMRVRANMTGEQVRNVLAFLQGTNTDPRERTRIEGTPEPPVARQTTSIGAAVSNDPGTIARGRELVSQKACVGCHVVGNRGGQVGPSLNGVVKRKGADAVRMKLDDPTYDSATSMMPNFGLSTDEIEAIVAYLATLNGE